MSSRRPQNRLGFTLVELIVVVAILGALAGLVLLEVGSIQDKAALTTTNATLGKVRDAIIGVPGGIGYQPDIRSLPPTLAALYSPPASGAAYNPLTKLGWRGPYLNGDSGLLQINASLGYTADYGVAGDPAPVDAWNHAIVIQIPASDPTYARIVSAGPDGVIQTPLNYLDAHNKPYPPLSMRGDDVVLFLLRPDVPSTP